VIRRTTEYLLIAIGTKGVWGAVYIEDFMTHKTDGVSFEIIRDCKLQEDGCECNGQCHIADEISGCI
jgi:hypothetical protein